MNYAKKPSRLTLAWLVTSGLGLTSLACLVGSPPATAIPVGLPESYEVQTATPTRDPSLAPAETTEPAAEAASGVLGLGDAPTHTPDPNRQPTPTATLVVVPTLPEPESEVVTQTLAVTESAGLTETTETAVVEAAPPPPAPAREPDPPRQGGDWDFEGDYVPWGNPYGEPCPGASVAPGWAAFVEDGPYGSSCFNENLYQPNVFSGIASQEITFDFISANSGVFRVIPTNPGHRYSITAFAKHDRSISVVQMSLGVDLSGGTEWSEGTVQWFPWDDGAEDTWVATEETVTATGEQMTIFIKGFHPMADQGGKTVIDNVTVTDLGP